MPIYEYQCEKCLREFELRRSFRENGEVVCPECTGEARRIYSPAPIIFKGSGFYVTDSRDAKKSTLKSGTESGSSESTSKPSEAAPSEAAPSPSPSPSPSTSDAVKESTKSN